MQMEVELEKSDATNKVLSFRCNDEHQKLKAMEHEMISERTKVHLYSMMGYFSKMRSG